MIYAIFNIGEDKYYLEVSNTKTISLKINDIVQNKIQKKLIYIIEKLDLDISTSNKNGNDKTTRQLGKQLILKLPNKEVLDIGNTIDEIPADLNLDFKEIEKGEIALRGNFVWSRVLINKKNYEFGQTFEKRYNKSLIYRWIISNEQETFFYIGETKQFSKRISQYLNPGKDQKTNIRINDHFKVYIDKGYKIHLDILDLNNIFLDENTVEQLDLKEYRRLFENYFILKAKLRNYKILNK